jgi:hypothetical protein
MVCRVWDTQVCFINSHLAAHDDMTARRNDDFAEIVQGGAVQVDPIKPKLKPPGIKRLKLDYDGVLSDFGHKFNLRRYNKGAASGKRWSAPRRSTTWCGWVTSTTGASGGWGQGLTLVHFSAQLEPFRTQNTP